MIHFVKETLLLFPYLFATYLLLEALESRAGGALERFLERSRSVGPLAGGFLGVIPQCGISAMASSFYAGGVITLGTLISIFLSTSDELVPVLISSRMPFSLIAKIVAIKVSAAVVVGFAATGAMRLLKIKKRNVDIESICRHSHCHCASHKGIIIPALVHTLEIFVFIAIVSAAIHFIFPVCSHHGCGHFHFNSELPLVNEMIAGLVGLIPNCAASVTMAKLYAEGAVSSGALLSGSFTGAGVGLLVLFRVNRNLRENIAILFCTYLAGTLLGWLLGPVLDVII